MTLDFFRVQQHKVAAFASGMNSRLVEASRASQLDEQVLVMIADEVLGQGRLLKQWQHERAGWCRDGRRLVSEARGNWGRILLSKHRS